MFNQFVVNQLVTTLTAFLVFSVFMNGSLRRYVNKSTAFKGNMKRLEHTPCNFGFDKVILRSAKNADQVSTSNTLTSPSSNTPSDFA